jgi:hypothetical protein
MKLTLTMIADFQEEYQYLIQYLQKRGASARPRMGEDSEKDGTSQIIEGILFLWEAIHKASCRGEETSAIMRLSNRTPHRTGFRESFYLIKSRRTMTSSMAIAS